MTETSENPFDFDLQEMLSSWKDEAVALWMDVLDDMRAGQSQAEQQDPATTKPLQPTDGSGGTGTTNQGGDTHQGGGTSDNGGSPGNQPGDGNSGGGSGKTTPETVPANFKLVDEFAGVKIYSHGGDYVVSVDLARGADLHSVTGKVLSGGGTSIYGGPNPEMTRISAGQALVRGQQDFARTCAVLNGEFFSEAKPASSPIAFPLIAGGKLVTEGFAAANKHVGRKLVFEIADHCARITPFDDKNIQAFRSSKAHDAVVSLRTDVNIDGACHNAVGRTFVGVTNPHGDGWYDRALIFVSKASTQAHADKTLKAFGATTTMMLDGGGSSQLRSSKHDFVHTTRKVPMFISVEAAPK